ncbi:uncharacterized protein ARMOST_15665 [Armillaria ostoyae]|uniref:Uncharacterized protein n=1 Tax=Armillaria ostoyae TaxID=47428 RepID=A0A284RU52_ARMOS|nr:uncharacterized protein ARMOST_15665 [Armillaria ostoyae]
MRASKQASAVKLGDDLDFPPRSPRLSRRVPALKTSCAVLKKGRDRFVQGSVNRVLNILNDVDDGCETPQRSPSPQMYDRFLPPCELLVQRTRWWSIDKTYLPRDRRLPSHWSSSPEVVGLVVGMQCKIVAQLSQWLALQPDTSYWGRLECVFPSLRPASSFGATAFGIQLRRLSIPQQLLKRGF